MNSKFFQGWGLGLNGVYHHEVNSREDVSFQIHNTLEVFNRVILTSCLFLHRPSHEWWSLGISSPRRISASRKQDRPSWVIDKNPCYVFCICMLTYCQLDNWHTNKYQKCKSVGLSDKPYSGGLSMTALLYLLYLYVANKKDPKFNPIHTLSHLLLLELLLSCPHPNVNSCLIHDQSIESHLHIWGTFPDSISTISILMTADPLPKTLAVYKVQTVPTVRNREIMSWQTYGNATSVNSQMI